MSLRLILLHSGSAIAMSLSAFGVTIVNSSFETDDASASPYYLRSSSVPSGWTQFGDGADLVHNTYTQGPAVLVDAHSGNQFIDLNQSGVGGGLYQNVVVASGTTYRLSFYTARWATNSSGSINYRLLDGNSLDVLANGTFSVNSTDGWIERTLDVTAISTSMRIEFSTSGESQAAPGLDTVSLTAVPEPSTLLFAVSSGLICFCRRRPSKRDRVSA